MDDQKTNVLAARSKGSKRIMSRNSLTLAAHEMLGYNCRAKSLLNSTMEDNYQLLLDHSTCDIQALRQSVPFEQHDKISILLRLHL